MPDRSKRSPKLLAVAAATMTALFPSLAAEAPVSTPTPAPVAGKAAEAPPEHVQVQHILIGFKGSVPGKTITRSLEEAKALAESLQTRAGKKGVEFGDLVKEYTDDAFPGIYGMCNAGVSPAAGERARNGMVKGFGDASFSLKVGEIGVSPYDPKASPFGWHIVKRLK